MLLIVLQSVIIYIIAILNNIIYWSVKPYNHIGIISMTIAILLSIIMIAMTLFDYISTDRIVTILLFN